jgi:hypothetical protein
MANEGHIKLHRKIQESAEWTLPAEQIKVMIAILLNANYKQSEVFLEGKTRTILPGQLLTSRDNLLKICGKRCSERKIRTAICNLQTTGFLTKETTKGNHTILTVNNWEIYQSNEKTSKKTTNDRPTTDQRPTRSEEGKESKEGKEENIYSRFRAYWNSKPNLTKCRSLEKIKSPLNGRLKEYSEQEILEAIDNYSTIIESKEHYFTYLWTFQLFLAQRNALPVFVTEAKPFDNYKIKKAEPKQHPMQPDYGWDDK